MNNKKLLILLSMIIIIFTLFTGCFQNEETITVNQLLYDIKTNISTDYNTLTINYSSYDENDKITINDKITNIEYNSENETTKISFFSNINESIFKSSDFIFEGDLTDSYDINDNVEIKLTIKHVIIPVSFGNNTFYYDVEIFKEQWVDKNYFTTNIQEGYPFKPMSKDLIKQK